MLAQSYPRDTSYTLYSALQKISRDYPFVRPALPELPSKVYVLSDLMYVHTGSRSLTLDVYYPKIKKSRRYPGVLMIFGGGWTSGSKLEMAPMSKLLAKRGYVVVAPEYRLSPEATFPAAVHDLKTAVRWMRANGVEFGMDTSKIGVLGCSAGAHLASLLGTTNGMALFDGHQANKEYKADVLAVVNIDGIVSFVHPEASPEWSGKSANLWLGSYSDNPERWRNASPLEYAGASTAPFLFVNSASPRFHAGRDDLIKILNANNIYSEVHTLGGAPHTFWLFHPWFIPTIEYVSNFLEKVFKGKGN